MGITNFGEFLRKYCPEAHEEGKGKDFDQVNVRIADALAHFYAHFAGIHARSSGRADRAGAQREHDEGMEDDQLDELASRAIAVDAQADALLEEKTNPRVIDLADAVLGAYVRFFQAEDANRQLAIVITDNHERVTPLKAEVQKVRAAAWRKGKDRRGNPRSPYDKEKCRFLHRIVNGRYEPLFISDLVPGGSPRVDPQRLMHSGLAMRKELYKAVLYHAVFNIRWPRRTVLILQLTETPVVILGTAWRDGKWPELVNFIETFSVQDDPSLRRLMLDVASSGDVLEEKGAESLGLPEGPKTAVLRESFAARYGHIDPYSVGEGELIAKQWADLLRAVVDPQRTVRALFDTTDTDMFMLLVQHCMRDEARDRAKLEPLWIDQRKALWDAFSAAQALRRSGYTWHTLAAVGVLSGCDTFEKSKLTNFIGHGTIYSALRRYRPPPEQSVKPGSKEYLDWAIRCVIAEQLGVSPPDPDAPPPAWEALRGKKGRFVARPECAPEEAVAERFRRAFEYVVSYGMSEIAAPRVRSSSSVSLV
jgi:hypothetical protein